jgi:hypothetical protein
MTVDILKPEGFNLLGRNVGAYETLAQRCRAPLLYGVRNTQIP